MARKKPLPPSCEECAWHAGSDGMRWVFDPKCIDCGGRYLWRIQRSSIPAEEKKKRLLAVLGIWTAMGHSEQELRALAKRNWGEVR